jgi:hypothetical protein
MTSRISTLSVRTATGKRCLAARDAPVSRLQHSWSVVIACFPESPCSLHAAQKPEHGTYGNCTSVASGSKCTVNCDPGYHPEPPSRSCSLGQWIGGSETVQQCIRKPLVVFCIAKAFGFL